MIGRTFYDEHPFDFLDGYSDKELGVTHPDLLKKLLGGLSPNDTILDIGCGAGRGVIYATYLGLSPIGLDISLESLRRMQQRCQRSAVVANNLDLPLLDGCAEGIISDGVIHHTGNARRCLAENARLLRSGGLMYLAIYKPGGRYYYLYRSVGKLLRLGITHPVGQLLIHATLLPLYYFVHKVKSGGKRTWNGARNLFYDYFITPQVTFHSKAEVLDWCCELGLSLEEYENNPRGNVHLFLLAKQ